MNTFFHRILPGIRKKSSKPPQKNRPDYCARQGMSQLSVVVQVRGRIRTERVMNEYWYRCEESLVQKDKG